MLAEQKKSAFRLLFLITTPKLAKRAAILFQEGQIPIQYEFRALGTATSEIMDLLGLGNVDKTILICVLPKAFADEMLKKLKRNLHLGLPNSGVAFTVGISGGSSRMMKMAETLQLENGNRISERSETEKVDSEYSMIMAIVDQGFSEEIMEAARPVGAGGGTVFHCRRIGREEAMHFWGIPVQQEREIIIILARKEDKLAIMQAIGESYGIKSEAHGMIFSLPVDGIMGLD